jgi:hypothetical protein
LAFKELEGDIPENIRGHILKHRLKVIMTKSPLSGLKHVATYATFFDAETPSLMLEHKSLFKN